MHAVVVITGLASGRNALSRQTGRGKKTVLERPECTCKVIAYSLSNVMFKHGIIVKDITSMI